MVGTWEVASSGILATQEYKTDGTFVFSTAVNQTNSKYKYTYSTSGNYSVSGGKILCTNAKTVDLTIEKLGNIVKSKEGYVIPDYSFDFAICADDKGSYLQQNYAADGERIPISSDSPKWYKQ